jgi:hypothetical protein
MKTEYVPLKRIEWGENCVRVDLGSHPEYEADMRVVLTHTGSNNDRIGTMSRLYDYENKSGDTSKRICYFTYPEKFDELSVQEIVEIARDSYTFLQKEREGRATDPDH